MPPGQARPAFGPPTSVATADNELVQSGLAMSSDVPPHGIYTPQHHPGMHPDHVAGHSATSLQSPNSSSFRRSSYTALPGINARGSHPPLPPTLYGSLPHQYEPSGTVTHAHRRATQSRARRSLTTRAPSDSIRETEENAPNATVDQLLDQVLDEGAANNTLRPNARQTQATDSISRKMAWKFAHHVLKKVEIQDLPESERTCAICYNDYGTESPEGLCEEPLRLPTCKHVFGDHCISRWFEESESCPYCRRDLELYSKHLLGRTPAQTFLAMLRAHGQISSRMTEEVYLNIITNLEQDDDMVEPREPNVPESDAPPAGRDSDHPSSSVWAGGPSNTTNWPARNPLRDATRYPHWLARASQQRGAYSPAGQERESHRQRRPRFGRFNVAPGAENADGDPTSPIRSTLQPLRPESQAQASTVIPSTRPEHSDRSRLLADAQGNPGAEYWDHNESPTSAPSNRLRPW